MHLRRRYRIGLVLAGIAVCATAWAALMPVGSESKELVYVIPKGTWARRMAGENIQVLPAEIHLTIGVKDVLVLHNDDDVPQLFGPVLIMPGQSFELPFSRASRYQFACSLHVSGQLDVVVAPNPAAGWARLRWRATALAQPGVLL
jgi:hypothetical protein